MTDTETFQIPLEVAEAYESRFVPAIFAEWAPRILDAAGVGPGDRVLDVACGTGIVARGALERVGTGGAVIGVDRNEAMLTVARRIAPDIDWRRGDAAALPVDDSEFDAVTCQMAMMFFPSRRAAFAEMARAARPVGTAAVVVPAALDVQPAYRAFVDTAVEISGPETRTLLATYWNCGDLDALVADAEAAGLVVDERATIAGTAHFASADDFVMTEIGASPLAARVTDDDAARICAEVAARLTRYDRDGRFDIPFLGHVLVAHRRAVGA